MAKTTTQKIAKHPKATKKAMKHTAETEVLKPKAQNKYLKHLVILLILMATSVIYSGTLKNSLTYWDDDKNVSENADIRGLTSKNIQAVFTKSYLGMYVPMTMISYMTDYSIAGNSSKMAHLTSLLLHLLSVLLVYLLILALVKNVYMAAVTSALFALHPLNVEAVGWISARSTLVYGLFYIASLLFYVLYVQRNRNIKYLVISLLLFVLSALSKSQAMTLPLLFFVVDYFLSRKYDTKAWIEKIPFLLVSGAALMVSFYFRKDLGTQSTAFSFFDNVLFSFYSIGFYFVKFFAPLHLSAYIPFPTTTGGLLPMIYYLSPLLIIALVVLIIFLPKYRKDIITGLLLFLLPNIMLMIKTVSVGQQIAAERYAYIPYIGLAFLLAVVTGRFYDLKSKYIGMIQSVLVLFFAAVMIFFSVNTYARVKVWQNDLTLWNDVIAKEPQLYYGYFGRANAEYNKKMYEQALKDYNKAIELNPGFKDSYLNRANVNYALKNYKAVISDASQTISSDSTSANAYYFKGMSNLNEKKYAEALADLTKALELGLVNPDIYYACAIAKENLKDLKSAIAYYDKGIALSPGVADAYLKRGRLKGLSGDYKGSIDDFDKSIELAPTSAESYANRGNAKFFGNDKKGACADWNKALEMGLKSVQSTIDANCK
ncbi:MAG: tetratricopeptide repeat protein [Bacteroidota bacterium]